MVKRIFSFLIIGCMLIACGGKNEKKKASDEEVVTVKDFISLYPEISLPFNYSDSSFPAKENDSLLIETDIFYKFSPDTSISAILDTASNPQFYPVGKFNNGAEETYLVTRGITNAKKVLLVTAFDKDQKYIAGLPIINQHKNANATINMTIDPKFNISKNKTEWLLGGEAMVQGNDVYVLNNSSKKFMLIMTDSLGEASGPLINPIDTLPKKHKYAGDYGDGKKNLISFRDANREERMQLFIHLENKKDGCGGELKGEVTFKSPTVAEYRLGGDPCVLQFSFEKSGVVIKEVEGCGSRLGNLQCSFNGTYAKHKTPSIEKPTSKKIKTKTK